MTSVYDILNRLRIPLFCLTSCLRTGFNLCRPLATKVFAPKELEENMEAKDQNIITMKNEVDFFILIERKLEKQGFEVVETLPPDKHGRNARKAVFVDRSTSRFAY
jgi:hypothetical protein